MLEPNKSQFIEFLSGLTPREFEDFVAKIWSERGWKANVTNLSGDSGIDVVATKHSPFKQKQLIQVKRYDQKNTVGSPEIQQYASLQQQEDNVDSVIIVTSSSFSNQAQQLAEKLNVKLLNGNELYALIESEGLFQIFDHYSEEFKPDGNSWLPYFGKQQEEIQDRSEHSTTSNQPFGSPVEMMWKSEIGVRYPRVVCENGTIFAGGRNANDSSVNKLYSIECGAGVTRSDIRLPDTIRCIADSGELLYVGCDNHRIYCINKDTGEGVWSFRGDGPIRAVDALNDIVCCRASNVTSSKLYALDAKSGKKVWSLDDKIGGRGYITIRKDSVYYTSRWKLFSINIDSGKVQWEIAKDSLFRTPEAYNNSVYICNNDNNHLYSVDAKNGAKQWSIETSGDIHSSPTISSEAIYIGCVGGYIYAFSHENGSKKWSLSTRGSVEISPVVTKNILVCGTRRGIIHFVDLISGDLIGEYEFGPSIHRIFADEGMVYALGKKGRISAIQFPK
jgi:outer membrane protein assembly factor BamB